MNTTQRSQDEMVDIAEKAIILTDFAHLITEMAIDTTNARRDENRDSQDLTDFAIAWQCFLDAVIKSQT